MNTVNQSVLDKSRLSTLANSSETAQAIFQDVSTRRRIRWETNLPRYAVKLAHKGFKVVEQDYENAWKGLEEIGAGVIVRGRNGKPDRFKWHYSLKEIGVGGLTPEQIGDIKPMDETNQVQDKPKRKYTRKGFDRSKHMRKMWAEGRIKGRGHSKLRSPTKTSNDLREMVNRLGKELRALKKLVQ